jgi:hypothetical protein
MVMVGRVVQIVFTLATPSPALGELWRWALPMASKFYAPIA